MPAFDAALVDAAQRSASWPFEEARKLVARIEKSGKKSVIFETGYGPSGLPHIGTFGEVARTSMVRHAFQVLTDGNTIPTRLDRLLGRPGRPAQGPGQRPEQGACWPPASRQAA